MQLQRALLIYNIIVIGVDANMVWEYDMRKSKCWQIFYFSITKQDLKKKEMGQLVISKIQFAWYQNGWSFHRISSIHQILHHS